MLKTCPSCNSFKLESFYRVDTAPVVSSLLSLSKKEALDVDTMPIELVVCLNCGFIFNKLYDFSYHSNPVGHDDQQGFSPTFIDFITRISKRLINNFNIENKTIIEIGCGKGDFLKLICNLGSNVGIGIDPAAEDENNEDDLNVKFDKSYYSSTHNSIKSDLICCRHTLEHISNTDEFIKLISKNTENIQSQILFFEVPDTTRILEDVAFWDIYYEHCSYFTINSITHLFEKNGFKIETIWLDYNKQYILLEAVNKGKVSTFFSKEEVINTVALTRIFKKKLKVIKKKWKKKFEFFEKENKKVVLWGGGSKPVGFLTLFAEYNFFKAVVDINPKMDSKFVPGFGIEIIKPERLTEINPDVIIVMNGIYIDEINVLVDKLYLEPEYIIL